MSLEIPYKPTWAETEGYIDALGKQIRDSEYKWDFRVPVSGGGEILSSYISLVTSWRPTFSLSVERIGGKKQLRPCGHLNTNALAGVNILLVEDVLETGETANLMHDFLKRSGAKTVKIACLFAKYNTKASPDFVLVEGLTQEVILPWEQLREV